MYKETNGMYSGYEVESNKEMNYQESKTTKSYEGSYAAGPSYNAMPGVVMPPIYECPRERVIHREFVHEVPHVCPVNTRIINHHIYKHTYSPCYTCCEENEVCNVTEGCCNNF